MTERVPEQPKKIIIDQQGDFELPEEQRVIWDDISKIIQSHYLKLEENSIPEDQFKEYQNKINLFEKQLKESGLEPEEYFLWHKIIGSGFHGFKKLELFFDTPDRGIEKFIRDLHKIE